MSRNGTNPHLHVPLFGVSRPAPASWWKRLSEGVTMTHVIATAVVGLALGGIAVGAWIGDVAKKSDVEPRLLRLEVRTDYATDVLWQLADKQGLLVPKPPKGDAP